MKKGYLNNKGKPIGEKGKRDKLAMETIRRGMVGSGIDTMRELSNVIGISYSTLYRRLDDMDELTRGELIQIVKSLNLTVEESAKLLGAG